MPEFDPSTGEVLEAPAPYKHKHERGNSSDPLCCNCSQRRAGEVPSSWAHDPEGRLWCPVCKKKPAYRAACKRKR